MNYDLRSSSNNHFKLESKTTNNTMSSSNIKNHFREDTKQREEVTTDHGDTADSYAFDAHHPTLSALTNNDPCALTTIFEPSKIKNFLYKIEPNMARINAVSLDLISTTATVLLKTLVEKAVLQEQGDIGHRISKKTRRDTHSNNERGGYKRALVTSNQLKSVVTSAKSPSSLKFLEETYENFRNKDGSFLPSKLIEYVPRKPQKRKQKATNQSAGTASDNDKRTALRKTDCAKSGGNENKRLKRNLAYTGSSLLLSSECPSDTKTVERAIANAAAASESQALDKIVEDEDDYD